MCSRLGQLTSSLSTVLSVRVKTMARQSPSLIGRCCGNTISEETYGAKPREEKLWRQMTDKQWYQDVWPYITRWSRALVEKLTGSQLVKKFSVFYGTLKFITAFRSSATCPYRKPDQSSPCLPILLLEDSFSYYLPSMSRSYKWSLSLRFVYQYPYALLLSPMRATCPAHLIFLQLTTEIIFGEEWRS